MRDDHFCAFNVCCFLDLATRLLVTTLLIAVVAAVAWKTLMPLPAWLEP